MFYMFHLIKKALNTVTTIYRLNDTTFIILYTLQTHINHIDIMRILF